MSSLVSRLQESLLQEQNRLKEFTGQEARGQQKELEKKQEKKENLDDEDSGRESADFNCPDEKDDKLKNQKQKVKHVNKQRQVDVQDREDDKEQEEEQGTEEDKLEYLWTEEQEEETCVKSTSVQCGAVQVSYWTHGL